MCNILAEGLSSIDGILMSNEVHLIICNLKKTRVKRDWSGTIWGMGDRLRTLGIHRQLLSTGLHPKGVSDLPLHFALDLSGFSSFFPRASA